MAEKDFMDKNRDSVSVCAKNSPYFSVPVNFWDFNPKATAN